MKKTINSKETNFKEQANLFAYCVYHFCCAKRCYNFFSNSGKENRFSSDEIDYFGLVGFGELLI